MLIELHIKNIAIIEEVNIEFGGGFVITNPEPVHLKDEEYQEMIAALKGELGI